MRPDTDLSSAPSVLVMEARAVALLKRARLSAWGALIAVGALVGLFLWGVNPSDLVYSLSVLVSSDILFALFVIAVFLPALTLVWIGWVLQSVRRGDWTHARRGLPAIVVMGYISLIGPGYYLHETLRLLNSPLWRGRNPTAPTAVN
jgi:uncharacterized membrane protein YGL010W